MCPWFAVGGMMKMICMVCALFVMKRHILINMFLSMWIVACVLWMAVGIGFGLGRALVI